MNNEANYNFMTDTPANIFVGIGWDVNRASQDDEFDLDASAFLLGEDGNVESCRDFVYYNNTKSANGAVVHTGDNRTGEGEGDDEAITVDFSMIPNSVKSIVFTVSIYDAENRKQNFGMLDNAYIRLYDEELGELFRYDLGDTFSSETAVVFGLLYRDEDRKWHFKSIGDGFNGGIVALSLLYGVFKK
ncbi:MAG: TerD family protein [Clostridia bacterium]|nr:TerD family protein [Clostridia bacterium]